MNTSSTHPRTIADFEEFMKTAIIRTFLEVEDLKITAGIHSLMTATFTHHGSRYGTTLRVGEPLRWK